MTQSKAPIKAIALTSTVLVLLASAAAAQEACSSYTVKDGDSLGSIAQAAYGSFDYQMIFNANRNAIDNPNSLVAGTVLQIPCEDGSLSEGEAVTEIIAKEDEKQAARAKSNIYEPPIKLVSGNGWAPFTGEDLKGGGMLVRLATTALNRGGNDREYNLSFVDDWASHFETLLPLGAFDISIAWVVPADCSKPDELDDNSRMRCTTLDATLPIYETVTAYWSRTDNEYASVRSFSDYAGATICRPEGWSILDLTSEGLVDPVVTYIAPPTARDCVEAVLNGTADMTSLDLETGGATVNEVPEAASVIQPNPNLSKLESLHFVTHKTNPRGRVYIAMLNKGLNEMRESGEWYAVIADSLTEYNKSKQ